MNKKPTVARYNFELYKSLRKAGVSKFNSLKGVILAIQEQISYKKMPWHKIDNIPKRTACR